MNTNYDIKIVPKNVAKTATKLKITTKSLGLYNSVNFMIKVCDDSDSIIDINYIELKDEDYLSWKNDDTFVKDYILQKLNYTENTENPPIHDENDYIVNVVDKNIVYTMDKLTVTFNSLKLFHNASFVLDLKDSTTNISYQTSILTLTNSEYLQWMNDDSFIKDLALQSVDAKEN